MMLEEKRAQTIAQCKVIAHLAQAMADLHKDFALAYTSQSPSMDESFYDMVGDRTAGIMEWLGDALNNMDAITDEDEWTNPVFEAAHKLWPQPIAPLPTRSAQDKATEEAS